MNKDEAINVINDYDINFERNTAEEIAEAFEMAIKAIRTIPSEDEKVIRIKKGTLKVRTGKYVIYDVEWLKEHFNTTEVKIYGQPKTGHWIKHKHNGKPYFNCSECLYFAPIGYSYCPGCGAKMQEGDK